ncbi:hypothetical protein EON81_02270 [bacterium]|nr:MAG: hypothetical protein EON81_02270 [bacterium]
MRLLGLLPALALVAALPFVAGLASAQGKTEVRGKLTDRLTNPEGKITLRTKGQTTAVIILKRGAGNVLEILSATDMNRDYATGAQSTTYSGKVSMRLLQGRDVIMQMNADDVVLQNLPDTE